MKCENCIHYEICKNFFGVLGYTVTEVRKEVEVQCKRFKQTPACGVWVAQDPGRTRFSCSVCKAENYGGHEKFCPNCGSPMCKEE